MKYLISFLILILTWTLQSQTVFTEFYVQTTGDNLNAGSTTNDAAILTITSGYWTNDTSAESGTYCKVGTDITTVTTQMWASVYPDGTNVAQFVGRITAVDTALTNITISLSAKTGIKPPSTTATPTTSIKIGGAWRGPGTGIHTTDNAFANGFPFNFIGSTATNVNGNVPRVNFKGGVTYNITNGVTQGSNGPIRFQGYTNTVADGGKAAIDGGTTAITFILLVASGINCDYEDFILSNNGTGGTTTSGTTMSGSGNSYKRIVIHDIKRSGFNVTGTRSVLEECEAYNCNIAAQASHGGFLVGGSSCILNRCISHDNLGANSCGFIIQEASTMMNCISESNKLNGVSISATGSRYYNLDCYNNEANGIEITLATVGGFWFENCNFIKNGTYGISSSGSSIRCGSIVNCGFGVGTMTNSSGNFGPNISGSQGGFNIVGTVNYPTDQTPWVDPDNGDFRISLAASKNTGRGRFTQTAAGYSGTVGYPDIGAAQHLTPAATTTSYTFAQ